MNPSYHVSYAAYLRLHHVFVTSLQSCEITNRPSASAVPRLRWLLCCDNAPLLMTRRDCGRPRLRKPAAQRLRSPSWHVQSSSAMEYATCLLVHERGECVTPLVFHHVLHPFRKNRWPFSSMLIGHLFVPSFLEPRPVVRLAW